MAQSTRPEITGYHRPRYDNPCSMANHEMLISTIPRQRDCPDEDKCQAMVIMQHRASSSRLSPSTSVSPGRMHYRGLYFILMPSVWTTDRWSLIPGVSGYPDHYPPEVADISPPGRLRIIQSWLTRKLRARKSVDPLLDTHRV